MKPRTGLPLPPSAVACNTVRQRLPSLFLDPLGYPVSISGSCTRYLSVILRRGQKNFMQNCVSRLVPRGRGSCSSRPRSAYTTAENARCLRDGGANTSGSRRSAYMCSASSGSGFWYMSDAAAAAAATVIGAAPTLFADIAAPATVVAHWLSATTAAPSDPIRAAGDISTFASSALDTCVATRAVASTASRSSPPLATTNSCVFFSTAKKTSHVTKSPRLRPPQPDAALACFADAAGPSLSTIYSLLSPPSPSAAAPFSSSSIPPSKKEKPEPGHSGDAVDGHEETAEDLRGVDFYKGARPLSSFRSRKLPHRNALRSPPLPSDSLSSWSSFSCFTSPFGPLFPVASAAERMKRIDVDPAAWQREAAAEQQFENEGWHLYVTSTRSPAAHILSRQLPEHDSMSSASLQKSPDATESEHPTAPTSPDIQTVPPVTRREVWIERTSARARKQSAAERRHAALASREARQYASKVIPTEQDADVVTQEIRSGKVRGGSETPTSLAQMSIGRKSRLTAVRPKPPSPVAAAPGHSAAATETECSQLEATTTARDSEFAAGTQYGKCRVMLRPHTGGAGASKAISRAARSAEATAETDPKKDDFWETQEGATTGKPAIQAVARNTNTTIEQSGNDSLRLVQTRSCSRSDARVQVDGPAEQARNRLDETVEEAREMVALNSPTAVTVSSRYLREIADTDEEDLTEPRDRYGSRAGMQRPQQQNVSDCSYTLLPSHSSGAGHVESDWTKTAIAASYAGRAPLALGPQSPLTKTSGGSNRMPVRSSEYEPDCISSGGKHEGVHISEYEDGIFNGAADRRTSLVTTREKNHTVIAPHSAFTYAWCSSIRSNPVTRSYISGPLPRLPPGNGASAKTSHCSTAICGDETVVKPSYCSTTRSADNTSGVSDRRSRVSTRRTRHGRSSVEGALHRGTNSSKCEQQHSTWSSTLRSRASAASDQPKTNSHFDETLLKGNNTPPSKRRSHSVGLTALDNPPPPLTYFDVMNKLEGDAPYPTAVESALTLTGAAKVMREEENAACLLKEWPSQAAPSQKTKDLTVVEKFFPALPRPRALSAFFTDGFDDWRYRLTREDDMLYEAPTSTESSCSRMHQQRRQGRCWGTPWSPEDPRPLPGNAMRRGAKTTANVVSAAPVESNGSLLSGSAGNGGEVYSRGKTGIYTSSSISQTGTGNKNISVYVPSLNRWKPIGLLSAQQLLHALQHPAASLKISTSNGLNSLKRGDQAGFFPDANYDVDADEISSGTQVCWQHQQLQRQNQTQGPLRMPAVPQLSVASWVSENRSSHLYAQASELGARPYPNDSRAPASSAVSRVVVSDSIYLAPTFALSSTVPSSNTVWSLPPHFSKTTIVFPLCYWRAFVQRLQRIAFSYDTSSFLSVVATVYQHLKHIRALILRTQRALDQRLSLCSFWSHHANAAASATGRAGAAEAEAAAAAEAAAEEATRREESLTTPPLTATPHTATGRSNAATAALEAGVSRSATVVAEASVTQKATATPAAQAACAAARAAQIKEEENKEAVKQLEDELHNLRSCYMTLAQQPLWECLGDNLLPHLAFASLSDVAAFAEAFTAVGPQHANVTSVLALQAIDKLHELQFERKRSSQQQQQRSRLVEAAATAGAAVAQGARDAAATGRAADSGGNLTKPALLPAFAGGYLTSGTAANDSDSGTSAAPAAAESNPCNSDSLPVLILLHLLEIFSEGAYAAAGVSVSPWSLPPTSFDSSADPSFLSSARDTGLRSDYAEQEEDTEHLEEEAAGTTQILARQLLTRVVALLQQQETDASASPVLTKAQKLQLVTHAALHWYHLPRSCRAYFHRVLDDLLEARMTGSTQTSCGEVLEPIDVLCLLAAAAPISLRSPAAPLFPIHRFSLLPEYTEQQQQQPQQLQRQKHLHTIHVCHHQGQLQKQQEHPFQQQSSHMCREPEGPVPPHRSERQHVYRCLQQSMPQQHLTSSASGHSLASFTPPLPHGVEKFLLGDPYLPTTSAASTREFPQSERPLTLHTPSTLDGSSSSPSLSTSLFPSSTSNLCSSSRPSAQYIPPQRATKGNKNTTAVAPETRFCRNAALPLVPLLAPSPLKAWNHPSGNSRHFLQPSHSYTNSALGPSPSACMRACALTSLSQLCALLDGSACTNAIHLPAPASLLPFFTNCTFRDSVSNSNARSNVSQKGTACFSSPDVETFFGQEMNSQDERAPENFSLVRCAYASTQSAVELSDFWVSLPLENATAASSTMAPLAFFGKKNTAQSSAYKTAGSRRDGKKLSKILTSSGSSEGMRRSRAAPAEEAQQGHEDVGCDTSFTMGEVERFSYLQEALSPSLLLSSSPSSSFDSGSASSAPPVIASQSCGIRNASALVPAALLFTVQRSLSRFTLLLAGCAGRPLPESVGHALPASADSPAAVATQTTAPASKTPRVSDPKVSEAFTGSDAARTSAAAPVREDNAFAPETTLKSGGNASVKVAPIQTQIVEEKKIDKADIPNMKRPRKGKDGGLGSCQEISATCSLYSHQRDGSSSVHSNTPGSVSTRGIFATLNTDRSSQDNRCARDSRGAEKPSQNKTSCVSSTDSSTCHEGDSKVSTSTQWSSVFCSTHMNSCGSMHSRSCASPSGDGDAQDIHEDALLMRTQSYVCRFLSVVMHVQCSQWCLALQGSSLLHALHSNVDALLVAVALYVATKRQEGGTGENVGRPGRSHAHAGVEGRDKDVNGGVQGSLRCSTLRQRESMGERKDQRQRWSGQQGQPQDEQPLRQRETSQSHLGRSGQELADQQKLLQQQQRLAHVSEAGKAGREDSETRRLLGVEFPGSLSVSKATWNTSREKAQATTMSTQGKRRRTLGKLQTDVQDSSKRNAIYLSPPRSRLDSSSGSGEGPLTEKDAADVYSPSVMTPGQECCSFSDDGAAPAPEPEKGGTATCAEETDKYARALSWKQEELHQLQEDCAACAAIHLHGVSFLLRRITLQVSDCAEAAAERLQQQETRHEDGARERSSNVCAPFEVSFLPVSSSSAASAPPQIRAVKAKAVVLGNVRGMEAAAALEASQQLVDQQSEKEDRDGWKQAYGGNASGPTRFDALGSVDASCAAGRALQYLRPPAMEALLSSVSRVAGALLQHPSDMDPSSRMPQDREVAAAIDVFYSSALECLEALGRFFRCSASRTQSQEYSHQSCVLPSGETHFHLQDVAFPDVLQRFSPSHLAAWLRCVTLLLTGTAQANRDAGLRDRRSSQPAVFMLPSTLHHCSPCLLHVRRPEKPEYFKAFRESTAFLFVIGACTKQKLQQSSQLAGSVALHTRAALSLFESITTLVYHLATAGLLAKSTLLSKAQVLEEKQAYIPRPGDTARCMSLLHHKDNCDACTRTLKDGRFGVEGLLNNQSVDEAALQNVVRHACCSLKDALYSLTIELSTWLPYAREDERARVRRAVHCFTEAQRQWTESKKSHEEASAPQLLRTNDETHGQHQRGRFTAHTDPYLDEQIYVEEASCQLLGQQVRRGDFSTLVLEELQPGTPIMNAVTTSVLRSAPLEKLTRVLERPSKRTNTPP